MSDDKTSEAVQGSETITLRTEEAESTRQSPVLRLRLHKPKTRKKVCWTTETVDNEHMDKKKSKCCCVYRKPKIFGESSSESEDDDCEHCSGHVDKKGVEGAKPVGHCPRRTQRRRSSRKSQRSSARRPRISSPGASASLRTAASVPSLPNDSASFLPADDENTQ